jgi:DNA invertase Pin-like site-specific DNA recombinase
MIRRMTRRVALYARCSTADRQTTENQIRDLRAVAEQHGWLDRDRRVR